MSFREDWTSGLPEKKRTCPNCHSSIYGDGGANRSNIPLGEYWCRQREKSVPECDWDSGCLRWSSYQPGPQLLFFESARIIRPGVCVLKGRFPSQTKPGLDVGYSVCNASDINARCIEFDEDKKTRTVELSWNTDDPCAEVVIKNYDRRCAGWEIECKARGRKA